MNNTKRLVSRLLSLALVLLLALTATLPALAEPVKAGDQDNLTVRIRNNEGLPGMSTDQFLVYQLFKGTPNREGDKKTNEWDATEWNNWSLADITWGESVPADAATKLVDLLKDLEQQTAPWAYKDGKNVFADISTAASLGEVLAANPENDFLQHFSATLMDNKDDIGLKAIDVTPTLGNGNNKDAEDDTLTFTFKDAGYYLFAEDPAKHTVGDAVSEYMLAVIGEQDILLKASVPQVDKDIVVGTTDKKGDAAGVGDYVHFKLTGTLPKNYGDFADYQYIFHDTLSAGLTYVNDAEHPLTVRVYANEEAAEADGALAAGDKLEEPVYKLVQPASDCSIEVAFDDLKTIKTPTITAQSVFVVDYYAQVNENAVIQSTGNPNTVQLEYSNDPNHDSTGKTIEKKVYVYAFGLDLKKVGSDAAKADGLEGAGFMLRNAAGQYAKFEDQYVSADGQTFAKDPTDGYTGPVRRLVGWVDAATITTLKNAYDEAAEALENATDAEKAEKQANLETAKTNMEQYLLKSGPDGKIPNVYGLDAATYYLEEVITPAGYNTMADFDISITANIDETSGDLQSVVYKHGEETITYKASYEPGEDLPEGETEGNLTAHFKSGLVQDQLVNQKAPFLPFTGGMGTLVFYLLGAALIVGAVTYLVVTSRKRRAESNA